jgi:hypothetical protein
LFNTWLVFGLGAMSSRLNVTSSSSRVTSSAVGLCRPSRTLVVFGLMGTTASPEGSSDMALAST